MRVRRCRRLGILLRSPLPLGARSRSGVACAFGFTRIIASHPCGPTRPDAESHGPSARRPSGAPSTWPLRGLPGRVVPSVYDDFELPNGGTPRSELDRIGHWTRRVAGEFGVCRRKPGPCLPNRAGRADYDAWQPSDPRLSRLRTVSVAGSRPVGQPVIHESLHALGLGENPPSSSEITQHVERRCW